MPIPKSRHYLSLDGEWTYQTLLALSKIKPETEAVRLNCEDIGAKQTVIRVHNLVHRYGFKVCCRTLRDGSVLAWVRKPGMDKNILKLWTS